jgi:ABC-2 type transport system permease protein
MRPSNVILFLKHTFTELWKRPGTKWAVGLLNVLAFFAVITAYGQLREQQETVNDYRQEVRERWESNPDKHPHRMAHYGYVAFRQPYPLSFFDRGVDSYVGNAVFLEAHRQNTVNFSAASLSTGLLRFGELSGALVLQALLPLLIFFWGFSIVAGEREDGKLRLVFAQGATWPEVILGKAAGLFSAALLVSLPTLFLTGVLLFFAAGESFASLSRFGLLLLSYGVYLSLICLLTVWVSAVRKTAKTALLALIGCWLLFVLVLPKVSQVAGQLLYPSPSKIAFDRMVEEEILKQGDSHNPDDPYFKHLKDSVLAVHQVSSTKDLPFNYGGFIMREGEKLSTLTFRDHERRLLARYEQQHDIVQRTALFNPYVAIKYVSMALAGTDFRAYRAFKDQAESYRYELAQTMNELQMEYIGNNIKTSADKRAVLDRSHWHDFPDFAPTPLPFTDSFRAAGLALFSLCLWFVGLTALALFLRRPTSVI